MYGSCLLKHGGFDSIVYYLCAIIQFYRFKYDAGTRHQAFVLFSEEEKRRLW